MRAVLRSLAVVALACALFGVGGDAGIRAVAAPADPPEGATGEMRRTGGDWRWPVDGFRIVRDWEAPAHRYGPGHRGIDLEPASGDLVRAPADGVVAFAGPVAGRPVLTIDHGEGVVTTLEPVSTSLTAGTAVSAGDVVGTIASGGHTAAGAVHFGVRVDGEYVNPRLFVGGIPRAVLLPCC